MKNLVASILPRRTLLATLLAGLAATAYADNNLVVSQIYGAGGNNGATYNRDFIELFNRSAEPLSLSGLYLHYHSATGTGGSSVLALPADTLEPGQYYLITFATGNNGSALDNGDLDSKAFSMGASAGRVSISTRSTSIPAGSADASMVEIVGFGNANVSETAAAPSPSATTSISRKSAGCIDTDNNAADFTAGAIAPRRKSTPFASCDNGPIAAPIVLNCPASLPAQQGSAASAILQASDKDSIVNHAAIVSSAVAGISLSGFAPASGAGGSASVTLVADASLATGNYPVKVSFTNDAGQEASCIVNVGVAGQLRIPQIQGSGAASPYANTVQSTEGVVTARLGNSFFLQDSNGDGDPTTSDGIYVFNSNAALVTGIAVGDRVRITGKVVEYRPGSAPRSYTEFTELTAVNKVGSGSINPTNVELPNADLARYEGMLVRFVTPLTVNQNKYLGERGELTLSHGRRENPTNRHPAGSPEAAALARENAANEIVLDDGIFSTPAVIPYLFEDGTVRAGDTVSGLTGVLDYGAIGGGGAAFKVQPTEEPRFARDNPRSAPPQLPAGVKVASANVLNFFTTFTNGRDAWGKTGQGCTVGSTTSAGECRGADNLAEFERQRKQIVASLKAVDADVVGLMEIQNNRDVAVGYLVEQLNAAIGQPTYAVVPAPATTGTDAIRVAMIYKPAVLTLQGGALSDGDRVNNRPPMAQTFKAGNGGVFSVVVNHFKSKGGCGGATGGDADPGNGQGCWDTARLNQARRLTSYFLPQVVQASGDPDVLVIGDLNAYAFENPINHLTASGMVNQIERFVRPAGMPYSYVFDGTAGYLDHALATNSLSPQVAGAAEWHNNADEPETLDYNLGDTPSDPYREGAYRASDHDPVVLSLNLTAPTVDVTASVKIVRSGVSLNRATGKYSGTVSFTNTSGALLAGPLHLRLEGLTAGVTLDNKSGEQGGAPYLTLPGGGLAPGATVTVTTVFGNPAKAAINYTAKLISGTY
jgi:predicted extracellular nuclease